MLLELSVDGDVTELPEAFAPAGDAPQILLLSDGEMTAFELRLRDERDERLGQRIRSEGWLPLERS